MEYDMNTDYSNLDKINPDENEIRMNVCDLIQYTVIVGHIIGIFIIGVYHWCI